MPEKEKLLQRIFQFLTAISLLVTTFIIVVAIQENPISSVPDRSKKIKNVQKTPVTDAFLGSVLQGAPPSDESFEYFQKEASVSPLSPDPYVHMGEIALTQKDFQKASENFHMASTLDPENAATFISYIESLLRQRKIIEAGQAMKENKTHTPELDLYRGYIALYLNERETGETLLKRLSSEHPDLSERISPLLGALEEFKSTTDGKIEYLQTLLAKAFDEVSQYELALGLALDAIKSRDDYRDAWIIAGHAALAAEKFAEAKQALERALQLDAQSPKANLYLAYTLQYLGEYGKAATQFQKAESFGAISDPTIEATLLTKAEASGHFEDALTIYESLLKRRKEIAKPDEYVHPIYLAIEKIGDPNRALALAIQLSEVSPHEAMSLNLLGWSYLALGDIQSTMKYLNAALAADPTLEAAYYNYGKLYESVGKTENALEAFRKSVQFAKEHRNISIEQAATSRLDLLTTSLKIP